MFVSCTSLEDRVLIVTVYVLCFPHHENFCICSRGWFILTGCARARTASFCYRASGAQRKCGTRIYLVTVLILSWGGMGGGGGIVLEQQAVRRCSVCDIWYYLFCFGLFVVVLTTRPSA